MRELYDEMTRWWRDRWWKNYMIKRRYKKGNISEDYLKRELYYKQNKMTITWKKYMMMGPNNEKTRLLRN